MDWNSIKTEERNPNTLDIDTLPTLEMVKRINEEDKKVALAVEKELPRIAKAVDVIAERMQRGGRLIYVGCGTSGRLGVLDAAECPPTFSASPEQVIGLMAGGQEAMFHAVEGAEDSAELGASDLKRLQVDEKDAVVGIAASGRTPYVLGALGHAREVGAATLSISCSAGSSVAALSDIAIAPEPGPEVITGSTRMKSGTAQKMVLNMLSTGAMIKLGKVYGNLMVDVKASNEKLIHRCEQIVRSAAQVSEEEAVRCLQQCDYRPKTAIVMLLKGLNASDAHALLDKSGGRVAEALSA